MRPLPIDPLLPEIVARLRERRRLVLRAAPGAGKTTRVPAAVLDAGLAGEGEVWVLEPRRIAAAAAAAFVAAERGRPLGDEVGYRVRFEERGGPATRLRFVTEGIAARRLGRDPFLEGVSVLVLDEFHERHVAGDLVLGMALELQETVRPDLAIVVLSATLEAERLAAFLDAGPPLVSEGRRFPVEVEFAERPGNGPLAPRVARAVERALAAGDGDVLAFLPGAGEIRRAAEALEPAARAGGIDVVPLHGELPLEAQRRAVERGPRRKVVLATNVAETSLTIEGVTAVVDSGLVRESRFDPRLGLDRLVTVAASRASAEQRAGRAGRTAPGRAIRLWTRAEHAERRERDAPEVRRVDLSGPLLELSAWGLRDPASFRWLDAPPEGALEAARALLVRLGALGAAGPITETGRRMLELPVAPRLARVLVEAERTGAGEEAALLAALLSEREILADERAFAARSGARHGAGASDLALRAELFEEAARRGLDGAACRALGLDPGAARAVDRARRRLARAPRGGARRGVPQPGGALRALLAGFPDRVCARREPGSPRAVMTGGRGVVLDPRSVVREARLFLAIDVDAGPRRELSESLVRAASAVERSWLEEDFPERISRRSELVFDEGGERVVARSRVLYEDLVLEERTETDVDRAAAGEILAAVAERDPGRALAVEARAAALLARLRFLRAAMPEIGLPDPDDLLRAAAREAAAGRRALAETRRLPLAELLAARLDGRLRRALEREAPERIALPSGRAAAVEYEAGRAPVAGARVQELFGLRASPRLAGGRVALAFDIRAPSDRAVQRTDDLASFWSRTYPEVRKELRGRYPKHAWPEDPSTAEPTSRPARRR